MHLVPYKRTVQAHATWAAPGPSSCLTLALQSAITASPSCSQDATLLFCQQQPHNRIPLITVITTPNDHNIFDFIFYLLGLKANVRAVLETVCKFQLNFVSGKFVRSKNVWKLYVLR